MAELNEGQKAPDFTAKDQNGKNISLSDFSGKDVILYFYPKDDTPGCTTQACAFRDSYEVFKDAGAEVIGISEDSQQSHEKFAAKYQLPFTLLSDTGNKVRQLYGVPATLWIMPGRVTYAIDKQGVVKHIFDSMLDFKAHVSESLKTLEGIKG